MFITIIIHVNISHTFLLCFVLGMQVHSSPLGGGGGENKKKEALWELAEGGGWSNITTDLALATPSSYH